MGSGGFYSKILELEIGEKKRKKFLPKALQYHPVSDQLIHFDFLRVQEDTKVTVEVPIEFFKQRNLSWIKKRWRSKSSKKISRAIMQCN